MTMPNDGADQGHQQQQPGPRQACALSDPGTMPVVDGLAEQPGAERERELPQDPDRRRQQDQAPLHPQEPPEQRRRGARVRRGSRSSLRARCRRWRSPVGSRAWPSRVGDGVTERTDTGSDVGFRGGRPSLAPWPYYRCVGSVPPKRHTQHRDEDGHLYREELMGEEGFSSDSSLLYHRGVPSAIVDSQVWELPDQTRTPNHPLKPRHLKLHGLFPAAGDGDRRLPGRGPADGPRQQRRPDRLRRHRHRRRRRSTATPSATSACTSSPAPAPSRPSSG